MDWLVSVQFVAVHYLVMLVLIFLSALVGERLLRRFPLPEDVNGIFLYTSLGTGAVIVVLFISALLKLFSVFFLSSVTIIFLSLYLLKKDYQPFLHKVRFGISSFGSFIRKNWYWFIPFVIVLSPLFLLPLYPPTKWDEISYHLPYAKFYVDHQGLAVNQFLRYPLYAHNIDLLYSLSLLLSDDIVAHLLHASTAVLTAIGIYNLGTITSDKKTGALASFLFLSSPIVLRLITTAYIDLGLTLFVFLGFYCLSMWSITKKEYWLYLAGFATGIAAGSKYSGLLFIPLYVFWIVYESRKIPQVVKFLIPALVFGAPWYIRNYIISGDPFSPFGGEFFGYWLWNKKDLISQSQNLFKTYGTPKNLSSMIMLPWNILVHPGKFMEGPLSPAMATAFLAPIFFKKFSKYQRILCIFVLANIFIWFFTSQILRYLLPVFPMIALLSSTILMRLYSSARERHILPPFSGNSFLYRILRILPGSIFAVAIVVSPSLYSNYLSTEILRDTLLAPLPVTKQMRDDYLSKRVKAFDLLQIANKTPNLNIYQLGFENSFYFAEGKMIGDWFGPARYYNVLKLISDSKMLCTKLSSMDIQLFLLSKSINITENFDRLSVKYLDLIVEDEHGWLYRLKT